MPSMNRRQELRKTLKKKKLEQVLSGESGQTVHAIINQNAMMAQMRRLRRHIPEDHKVEIAYIRQEKLLLEMLSRKFAELGIPLEMLAPLPRAIKQLNLLERLTQDRPTNWAYNGYNLDDLLSLINIFPQSDTIH